MKRRFGGMNRFFQRNETSDSSPLDELEEIVVDEARLKPPPGTTILVVDDSKTIHVLLSRLLIEYGYMVLSAYDGEEGLKLARQRKPALILMDVVMPGINGFQATRDIRKDPDPMVAEIPVLIMSGNAQPTQEFWSLKIKANGFIAKPFNNEELLDYIEGILFPALGD